MAGVVRLEVVLDESGAVTGIRQLGGELKAVEPPLQKVGRTGNVVFTGITKDTERANRAASILQRTLGIQLPRGMDSVLAKSRLIGPALAAAFNISIVLAIGAALVTLIQKIPELTDKWAGLTDEVKAAAAAAADFNREMAFAQTGTAATNIEALSARLRELESELSLSTGLGRTLGELNPLIGLFNAGLEMVRPGVRHTKTEIERLNGVMEKWKAQLESVAIGKVNEARQAAERWAEKLREIRAAVQSGRALELPVGNWKQAREELEKARAARLEQSMAEIGNELQATVNPGFQQMLANLQAINQQLGLGPLGGGKLVLGSRESANAILEIERDLQIQRLQLQGDTVGAMLLEERRRAEETIAQLKAIGASEEEIARARELVNQQTSLRIGEENKKVFDELAGRVEGFLQSLIQGGLNFKNIWRNLLNEMLNLFIGFVSKMIARWLTGIGGLQGGAGGLFGGGGGGGLFGGLFGQLFGFSQAGAGADRPATPLGVTPPGGVSGEGRGGIGGFFGRIFGLGGGLVGGLATFGLGLLGGLIGSILDKKVRKEAERQEFIRAASSASGVYGQFLKYQLEGGEAIKQIKEIREQLLRSGGFLLAGLTEKRNRWFEFERLIDEIKKVSAERGRRQELIGQFGIPEFAAGGFVNDAFRAISSGQGKILAFLHRGEAVLNARAVARLGPSFIQQANRAPSMQSGGFAGPAPAALGAGGVTLNFQPGSIVVDGAGKNARQIANELWPEIQRKARQAAEDQGKGRPF